MVSQQLLTLRETLNHHSVPSLANPHCFILGGENSIEGVVGVGVAWDGTGVHQTVAIVLESHQQAVQLLQLLQVVVGGQGKVQQ